MQALPGVIALIAAIAIAPALQRGMRERGVLRANYRDRSLPCPFGLLVIAAAVLAMIPVGLLRQLGVDLVRPELGPIAVYALGVAFLGLVDDVLGSGRAAGPPDTQSEGDGQPGRREARTEPGRTGGAPAAPRGWRGHARAVARGGFSSGALKAAGSLGLAMLVMSGRGYEHWRYALAVLVLVLATNLFNLLDLRPGRAVKAFVLLGAGLTVGALDARPLAALGLFVAPVLVAGLYDLRERAMLGDTGSNLIGGLAGLWIVLALGAVGQLVALGVLLAITVYGELRSISRWIERTPLVRRLDSLGRPA